MDSSDAKLKKLEALLKLVDESISKEEFVQSFNIVIKLVQDLKGSNKEEFELMRRAFDVFAAKLEDDSTTTLESFKAQMQDAITAQIDRVTKRVESVKDGKPGPKGDRGEPGKEGKPGKPGKNGDVITGDEIIKKINKADAYISKDAVQGMAELEKAVKEKTGNTTRIGWGAHPLTIKGLGVTIDKNARVINFKGTAITSVARAADGTINVTIDQGGASGTLVSEEVPTNSGDNLNFTLAHTPTAGTLRVYRGGARQQSIGVTPDYSLSGTTLTLNVALASGEVLMVDYSY